MLDNPYLQKPDGPEAIYHVTPKHNSTDLYIIMLAEINLPPGPSPPFKIETSYLRYPIYGLLHSHL
jgi:hypothetical protein